MRLSLSRPKAVLLALAIPVAALAGLTAYVFRGGPRFVEYPMAHEQESPTAVAAGTDGSVWFTIDRSEAIGRVHKGTVERIATSRRNLEPLGLGVAPDGSAYFTDASGGAIARVSRDGEQSRVKLNTPIVRLGRLALAPDGSAWFAEPTSYSITQLKDGALVRHEIDSPRGGPFGVAVAASGAVWATLQAADQLLRIDKDGGTQTFDLPSPGSVPTDIAVGPDGSAWFIEIRGNRIGRLQNGKVTEVEVGFKNAGLSGIAVASDGSVWFGMLRAASLGRLRDGKIELFSLPRKGARPFTVAVDSADNVWYADISGYVGMLNARDARN